MQEAIYPKPQDYSSFNDFFIRRLKAGARPLAASPLISPADGTLDSFGIIWHSRIPGAKAGDAFDNVARGLEMSGNDSPPTQDTAESISGSIANQEAIKSAIKNHSYSATTFAQDKPRKDSNLITTPGRDKKEARLIRNIKGADYSVGELMGLKDDNQYVRSLSEGQYSVIYLAPHNYHRVHLPCAARLLQANFIPGMLYSVNAKSVSRHPSLYAHNQRLACVFETKYGLMGYVMVAALIVSSIGTAWGQSMRATAKAQTYNKQQYFAKGDELGYFEMGSTVVLLLENCKLKLNPALKPGSPIQMGQGLYEL